MLVRKYATIDNSPRVATRIYSLHHPSYWAHSL